jgi:ankyrin repeat protein
MSKYTDRNIGKDISGTEIFLPNIDDNYVKEIFSNILSGNTSFLFERITPDINLNFTDENNNSVTHLLLKADSKLITEETKISLLKFFLEHNAPLSTYNKEKLTPLHIAVLNNECKIVEFLMDKVNVNAYTNNNLNSLMLALRNNISVCPDLIIPDELNKDQKKDENKLRKLTADKLEEFLLSKPYFGYFKQIFEDFVNGQNYNKDKIDSIITKYLDIVGKKDNSVQNVVTEYNLEKFLDDIKDFDNINENSFDDKFDISYDINEDFDDPAP